MSSIVSSVEKSIKIKKSSRQSVQVIERAASIMRALQNNSKGLSLGEIAKEVGLARSTVQRIVDALVNEYFVIASSTGRGFRLGPALIPLGSLRHFPIIEIARPILENTAKLTSETVDLSVSNQENMVFIDQIPSAHRLAAASAVGVSFQMHSAANGKAALALMSEDELNRYQSHAIFNSHTQKTISDWDKLIDELHTIRETGIAYDIEEHTLGICAVAVAVRASNNDLIAVSIPAPTSRFNETKDELSQAIIELRENLTNKLTQLSSDNENGRLALR